MEHTPVQRVLIALSTVGPDHVYEHPGKLVAVAALPSQDACSIPDVAALRQAVEDGLAFHPDGNVSRFRLTERGQYEVWRALGVDDETITRHGHRVFPPAVGARFQDGV